MYELDRSIVSCHLAGFTFHDGVEQFSELKVGTPLTLRGEPDNPHDPKAVAIYHDEKKLGYLPLAHNHEISRLLYYGHTDVLEAFVNRVSPDEHPERQIGIVVRVRDARG